MRHFLIIGAQRCGTTYLYSLLDAHPEIAMARPTRPEPKVFLSAELASKGYRWYRETYFDHVNHESALGEKSTSYLESADAADRAAQVLGPVPIIVLLRDPVERAVSNWRFSTANGLETRPLMTALRENLTASQAWDPRTSSVSPFAYLERGRYAHYLKPWAAAFPTSLQVLFLDDLKHDDDVLVRLFEGLGVDPGFRPHDRGRLVNESRGSQPDVPAEMLERMRQYFAESDAALTQWHHGGLPWPTRPPERGAHR